jgi:hypothetical protein
MQITEGRDRAWKAIVEPDSLSSYVTIALHSLFRELTHPPSWNGQNGSTILPDNLNEKITLCGRHVTPR